MLMHGEPQVVISGDSAGAGWPDRRGEGRGGDERRGGPGDADGHHGRAGAHRGHTGEGLKCQNHIFIIILYAQNQHLSS